MFVPAKIILSLCFSVSDNSSCLNQDYVPYTTSQIITTEEMYNVNTIIEKIFIQK